MFCCSAQLALWFTIFFPSLTFELRLGPRYMHFNKLGTHLCGAVKSAQRLPSSLLAAFLLNRELKHARF